MFYNLFVSPVERRATDLDVTGFWQQAVTGHIRYVLLINYSPK